MCARVVTNSRSCRKRAGPSRSVGSARSEVRSVMPVSGVAHRRLLPSICTLTLLVQHGIAPQISVPQRSTTLRTVHCELPRLPEMLPELSCGV